MAVGGSVEIVLKLDGLQPMLKGLGEAEKGFENASKSAKDMIKSLESSSKELKQAGDAFKDIGKTMVTGIAVPYATAMTALGSMYSELEYGFAKAGTLLSPEMDMDTFTKSVLDQARATGVDASHLIGETIYEALSSDISEKDVLDLSLIAHKLSTAGFTDSATAMDVLTSSLNAYGWEVDQAMRVSDLLIATQDYGKASVDELGKFMGNVIPIASANNVSFEELSGTIATLTLNGISASVAVTGVRGMLNELGRSGSRADEVLRELTGKGFKELMAGGMSLTDVLGMLEKHADDNGLSMQDMFGNIRAGSTAMSLLGDEGNGLEDMMKRMGDTAGTTDENFGQISETMQYKMTKAFNDIKTSGYEIALSLAPVWETVADVMGDVADSVKKLADWFVGLSDSSKRFIVIGGLVMSVLSVLILVIGVFLGALGNITGSVADIIKFFSKGSDGVSGFGKVLKAFGGIFKAVFSGIVAVLKGVGGIFKGLWIVIKGFGSLVIGGLKALASLIMAHPLIALGVLIAVVVGAVIKNWDTLGPYFKKFWDKIATWFSEAWSGISDFFSSITDSIKTKASEFGESVKASITEKIGALKDTWNEIWTSVSTFFSETWSKITDFASSAWETLKNVFTVGFLLIKEIVSAGVKLLLVPFQFIYYNVIQYAQWLWDKVGDTVMSGVDWVVNKVQQFGHMVTVIWNQIWTGISDFLVGIWDGLVNIVTTAVTWVYDVIRTYATFAYNFWKGVWTSISDFFIGIWNGITAFLEPHLQAISDAISSAWTWVKDLTISVWTSISEFFTKLWKTISDTVEKSMAWVSEKVSAGWNWIKDLTKSVWDGIVKQLKQVWETIKNAVTSFINSVKSIMSSVWTSIKNTTLSIWNGIKSVILGVWRGIVSAVTNFVNTMKSGLSTAWTSIKNVARNTWNGIRDAIVTPISKAWDKVKEMVEKIKNVLKFKWELPKLKMPHFSLKGKFSLTPPSVPKMAVDWYATGGIATGPSIVGIGEAGDEAILPLSNKSKMKPFAVAVSSMMKKDDGAGENTVAVASQPTVISVQIDGREIARATADHMDGELRGRRDSKSRARGGY